jgi:hypothetical protein
VVTACQVLTNLVYSWLFPQVDAALHHGGAGTTGASLRGTVFYLQWIFFLTMTKTEQLASLL